MLHPLRIEFGRRAEARVEAARAQVAALIGAAPADIVFTSGATESNNLAILGVARASAGKTPPRRHDEDRAQGCARSLQAARTRRLQRYVRRAGFGGTRVSRRPFVQRCAPDTVLVSVMHANNEIGVIQDIRAIGELCRERGVAVPRRCRAVRRQAAHRCWRAACGSALVHRAQDLRTRRASARFTCGRRRGRSLRPVTFGGGQERGLRPGTLPTHQIVGFGAACELAAACVGYRACASRGSARASVEIAPDASKGCI